MASRNKKPSPEGTRRWIHAGRRFLKHAFTGLGFMALGVLLAAGLATGCKPEASTPTTSTGYFQTPFQTESQFIVETIVSDLAEQMYFAVNHRLPEKKYFSVSATEKPGSPKDAPGYALQIRLDPKLSDLKLELNINGPIWSPAVYQIVAEELARAVGLKAGTGNRSDDRMLLARLRDGTTDT